MGIRADPGAPLGLYDLWEDPAETRNVAAANPDVVARVWKVMRSGRTPSEIDRWNFPLAAEPRIAPVSDSAGHECFPWEDS